MPNTKRTQRLRGVCDGAPKYSSRWGGGCPLLPNATWVVPLCEVLSTLPGSKAHHAQRIASELGGSHVWPSIESSLSRTAVRIGKARSRSR